ncbi:MAG: glutathione S-transferase family protein [Maricaulaceae bacterium]
MGLLVDGVWRDQWYDTGSTGGRFKRQDAKFRNWVTADGSAGPTGEAGFKAEPGRYHLYVAYACPWAHRTLIYRALKGLVSMIDVSVFHWFMGENGWTFQDGPGVVPDPLNGASYAYDLYVAANPTYSGRATVPILWDKAQGTIVSNESADLIRMFNTAFDGVGAAPGDYYPEPLRAEIDTVNERVYHTLNNGVYKCGFATTQAAYDEAVEPLFETLDWLEARLAKTRYVCGDQVSEADWRLFPTLFRFDLVYNCHFKCTRARISDYPNLWGYTRELYQWPGVKETTNIAHVRNHYYQSHETVNPHRIVPLMPKIDFDAPHGRGG